MEQNYKQGQLVSLLNPFPQSTPDQHYTVNTSTLSRLVPFRFFFQAATTARPTSLLTTEDQRQMESILNGNFINLEIQIKSLIMNISQDIRLPFFIIVFLFILLCTLC